MKKTIRFFKRFSLPIVIFFLFTSFSMAAAPLFINYQGKLTNSSGEPVNGAITVTFKFYNHLTLSDLSHTLGSPDPISVTPVNGVFSTTIPVQASWFSGTEVYLGVSVDGGAEMAPRHQLVSTPYALAVNDGAVRGGLNGTIQDGTIDSNDVDSISLAKISGKGALAGLGTVRGGLGGLIDDNSIESYDIKDLGVETTDLKEGAVTKTKIDSSASTLMKVYKTKGDERLVLGPGNYTSSMCWRKDSKNYYYNCDGVCEKQDNDDAQGSSCPLNDSLWVGYLVTK